MQLISLKKRINASRDLQKPEQDQINELLNLAGKKSVFEVEIGSGNGHFFLEYTREKNNTFFTGIELKKQRCLKILKKLETNNIRNSCIIYGNAENFIYNLPEASVDHYHIYFPDPWPKAKHKKRRFFRMPNLDALCRSLKVNGKIFFATDIFDYYLQAKVLVILHKAITLLDITPPPVIFKSLFANRFTELEKPLYFIAAIKQNEIKII